MKNLIKIAACSLMLLLSVPLTAQEYHIMIAPPALHTEIIPDQPFANAVWQPGFYLYDPVLENYTWVSGRWTNPPAIGAAWVAPSYEYNNGEYIFMNGRWVSTSGTILTLPRRDDRDEDLRERNERMNKIKKDE